MFGGHVYVGITVSRLNSMSATIAELACMSMKPDVESKLCYLLKANIAYPVGNLEYYYVYVLLAIYINY